MEFGDFIGSLWNDHAGDPAGVLRRCEEGVALLQSAGDVMALARITTHVAGEHLGLWQDGMRLLTKIRMSEVCQPGEAADKAVAQNLASLALCAGDDESAQRYTAQGLSGGAIPQESDRVRILAVAAAALAGQKRTGEAVGRFQQALSLASYGPTKDDPAARSLAITGNNLAYGLEEQAERTFAETELMILAAKTARRYWEVAGTWLEVERAEYRLAMSMIAAGRPDQAIQHAKTCLDLCEDNAAVPYEQFYGREILARAHFAAGDVVSAKIARDQAAALLPVLKDEVVQDCRSALDRLDKTLSA